MWSFTSILSWLLALSGIFGNVFVKANVPDVVTADQLEVKRAEVSYLLVLFHDGVCDDSAACRQARTGIMGAVDASPEGSVQSVQTGDAAAVARYGVTSLPRIGYFRQGTPILFGDKAVELADLHAWMNQNREVCTRSLDDATFEHDTQAASGATTGDWFILFYTPECATLLAEWEAVACRVKHRLVTGAVDVSANPGLRTRFEMKGCPPSLVFFRQGKMYPYMSADQSQTALARFAEGEYSNVSPAEVPELPSATSIFFGSLKDKLKEKNTMLFVGVGAACLFVLLSLVCLCGGKKRSKFD